MGQMLAVFTKGHSEVIELSENCPTNRGRLNYRLIYIYMHYVTRIRDQQTLIMMIMLDILHRVMSLCYLSI